MPVTTLIIPGPCACCKYIQLTPCGAGGLGDGNYWVFIPAWRASGHNVYVDVWGFCYQAIDGNATALAATITAEGGTIIAAPTFDSCDHCCLCTCIKPYTVKISMTNQTANPAYYGVAGTVNSWTQTGVIDGLRICPFQFTLAPGSFPVGCASPFHGGTIVLDVPPGSFHDFYCSFSLQCADGNIVAIVGYGYLGLDGHGGNGVNINNGDPGVTQAITYELSCNSDGTLVGTVLLELFIPGPYSLTAYPSASELDILFTFTP